MAKGMYIGVNNVARKIKKAYIGVNGIARKIKKIYMGVNNIARLIWSGGDEISSTVKTISLSINRFCPASAAIGDYALIAGGGGRRAPSDSPNTRTVDAFNSSLTRTSAPELSLLGQSSVGTSVGGYAVFAGGDYDTVGSTVNAYNSSLTRTVVNNLVFGEEDLSATSVGNYALFAGYSSMSVYVIDSSLTKASSKYLQSQACYLAATSVGNYALFGGGYKSGSGVTNYVHAFDSSLTMSRPTNLTNARYMAAATSVGNYALFGGGTTDASNALKAMNDVDVYSSSLTKSIATPLSECKHSLYATSVGNFALFGGGKKNNDGSSNTNIGSVDSYNISLTKKVETPFSSNMPAYRTAVSIGIHALFAGGNPSSLVDVYSLD